MGTYSRDHIYGVVDLNVGRNVAFDDVSDEFEIGSTGVMKWVTRSNHKNSMRGS